MAKSKESFNKKEKEKKRLQGKKDKQARKEQRKAEAVKGKGIESMMAYVDENGNLSSTPPDPKNKIEIRSEDIIIGVQTLEERMEIDKTRKGIVSNFNTEKGYGFIRDIKTNESFFVHVKSLLEPVIPNNKVSFQIERGQKGMVAVEVKKIV